MARAILPTKKAYYSRLMDTKYFSEFSTSDKDGNYILTLSVEGIKCISCVKLIEKNLHQDSNIVSARVNMSTNRVTIIWKGIKEHGDILASIITNLGYKIKVFDIEENINDISKQKKSLLYNIAISGFAMGNLMTISIVLWFSAAESLEDYTKYLLHYISALIALPAIIYSSRPFFYSALSALKNKRSNMDVPIAMAVLLASGMSFFETINHGKYIYFESVVMLLFFLLIGRYLDIYAKGKARDYAQSLLSKISGTTTVIKNGVKEKILIKDLQENMSVFIATGENIPADGMVINGSSDIDMSLINGETLPKYVKKGDKMFAGTNNLTAPIEMIVTQVGESSLLGDIVKLMEKAEQSKSYYVRIADRVAALYTPVIHLIALITFFIWWLLIGQMWQESLLIAITVLIITCPCALGLAVPIVQTLACSKLMKKGIILKSGDALEKLASIDTVIFDKTGTLTMGKLELSGGSYKERDLHIAASLGSYSKHPVSRALHNSYKGKLIKLTNIKEHPGKGIEGVYQGKRIKLGNNQWCNGARNDENNHIRVFLSVEESKPVSFVFKDVLRPDTKNVIDNFKKQNKRIILLSGDECAIVKNIANKIAIKEYYAEYSPIEKANFLDKLKSQGSKILMVGDGLNDTLSISTADVSISPSSAVDITQNKSDIVFQGESLNAILYVSQISHLSQILVKQNFVLAICYNIIAIPIAVMGYVTPLIAAIAMSSSSILVIANSFKLNIRRK